MVVIHNNDNNFIPYICLALKNIKSGRMPLNRKHTRSNVHLRYNVSFSQQSCEYFFKSTDYYNDVGCGGVSGSSMTDPSLKQFPSANPPPPSPTTTTLYIRRFALTQAYTALYRSQMLDINGSPYYTVPLCLLAVQPSLQVCIVLSCTGE